MINKLYQKLYLNNLNWYYCVGNTFSFCITFFCLEFCFSPPIYILPIKIYFAGLFLWFIFTSKIDYLAANINTGYNGKPKRSMILLLGFAFPGFLFQGIIYLIFLLISYLYKHIINLHEFVGNISLDDDFKSRYLDRFKNKKSVEKQRKDLGAFRSPPEKCPTCNKNV